MSSAGVQPTGIVPFDVVHPVGNFSFGFVPSASRVGDLEIHQLKYPTDGASQDLNVIFPVERLRELAAEELIGGLTPNFFSLATTWIRTFHRALQRRVIVAALQQLSDATFSGEIHDLPVTWAQARREAALLTQPDGTDRKG